MFKPSYEFRWLVTATSAVLQMRYWQGQEDGWGEWQDIPYVYENYSLKSPNNLLTTPD